MKEQEIQEKFERLTGCGHQSVPGGVIDILTPKELIEIKNWDHFDTGIGQLYRYSVHYPDRQKRLHCFGELPMPEKFDLYQTICRTNNIVLTYEDEDIRIRQSIIDNREKIMKQITCLEEEIQEFEDRMIDFFEDYMVLDSVPINPSVDQGWWDVVLDYDGYPFKQEVRDDLTMGNLRELIQEFPPGNVKLEDWKVEFKVMGEVSLHLKIFLDFDYSALISRLEKEIQNAMIFKVVVPVIVVNTNTAKEALETLLFDKTVYILNIKDIVN